MLVLSRQRDEKIMVGDTVEITVVDIRGDKVRLGINAPKNMPVHREEVYRAIKKEAKAKTTPDGEPILKPCPFCGNEAQFIRQEADNTIGCSKCGASTVSIYTGEYESQSEIDVSLANRWNKRA